MNGTSIVTTFEPLSSSQRKGIIVVATFSLLSASALVFIALRTIRLAILLFLKRDNSPSQSPEILFFRAQLGHYVGCLILSNMFISVAGLINFSWVSRSGLSPGSMCSAQALLMQIGIWGTCWFTFALGVHALSSLGFHIPAARWCRLVNITLGWTAACVAALVPLQKSNVYGPTETSCSIMSTYSKQVFVLEALPVIFSASGSTAVHFLMFTVWRGKLSVNSAQRQRGPSSTSQQEEDGLEEYHQFISMIARSMFWFPLASVPLLLPFCFTHILIYAGYSVPSASSIFADVCVSMLGFVNVILLHNAFRVISSVYHSPPAVKIVAEADTPSGSLVVPQPIMCLQPTISSYASGRGRYNSPQSSSKHWSNSAWSRVNSNTKLPDAGQEFHGSTAKVGPQVLNSVMPFAEFSRFPIIIPPQSNAKKQNVDFQSDSSSHTLGLGPYYPRVSSATSAQRQSLASYQRNSSQPTAGTNVFRNGEREPTFKPKAPSTLNPSRFPVPPPKVNTWSLDNADESVSRPCSSHSAGSELHHSGGKMDVCKVRPLPQAPDPNNDEENTVEPNFLNPRHLRAQSSITVTTVWSQESGYTMG